MLWPVVVAWIHYIGIMLLLASLLGEHLVLKQEMAMSEARTLQRLDIIYGGSALLVLVDRNHADVPGKRHDLLPP